MFTVYILKSSVTDKYYIGQTSAVDRRLLYHNSGYSKSTKAGRPWRLIYSENYASRQQAMNREKELKKYKSRTILEKIISKQHN